jgi:hypothetical protein
MSSGSERRQDYRAALDHLKDRWLLLVQRARARARHRSGDVTGRMERNASKTTSPSPKGAASAQ